MKTVTDRLNIRMFNQIATQMVWSHKQTKRGYQQRLKTLDIGGGGSLKTMSRLLDILTNTTAEKVSRIQENE
jgi:hypothetical protein